MDLKLRQPNATSTTTKKYFVDADGIHPIGQFNAPSPFLINLKPPAAPPLPPPKRMAAWRRALDSYIHLADLRLYRSVSIRPRGLNDFPPRGATRFGQALLGTIRQFFSGHPLADLTVFTLLHLTVALVWGICTAPFKLAHRRDRDAEYEIEREDAPRRFLPVFPMFAVPVPVPTMRHSLIGFMALTAALLLPLGTYSSISALASEKENITAAGIRGVSSLKEAGLAIASRGYDQALSAFTQAAYSFQDARREAGPIGNAILTIASFFPSDSPLSSAAPLMSAGREAALGGAILTKGLAALDSEADPLTKINSLNLSLGSAMPHFELAASALDRVNPAALPEQYRAAFEEIQGSLPTALDELRRAKSAATVLPILMGSEAPQRYLVVFQNNAELRPTGGFIGSFALVDVADGRVSQSTIPGGGSYDLQGSLRLKLAAPQPLRLINPNWEFQDANWFPDYPTSARKLSWFYENSGGPTVDGVIAMTARLMEKLLEVTGPIEMPAYGKTIDSQNFWLETQRAVELEYDRVENRPKQFLADLAPLVLERLQNSGGENLLRLATTLDDALRRKDIMLWLANPTTQERIDGLGWSGAMRSVPGDYLQVVHTNIAGQKTDLMMQEKIEHAIKLLPDGSGIVTLTVNRTHNGVKGALFTGVRNVDYLRVYVPTGSLLMEASGFNAPDPKLFDLIEPGRQLDEDVALQEESLTIDNRSGTRIFAESGKTVFGNWVQTDPGQTSIVTLVYKLPPGTITTREPQPLPSWAERLLQHDTQNTIAYSLLVQKQPGANDAELVSFVDLPRGYRLRWQAPQRTEDERGRWQARTNLDRDMTFDTIADR